MSSDGMYRTDYLPEGEWFVGIYDTNGESHAADQDLQAVTGEARELDKEVTLTGRTVLVPGNRPIDGVDFTLAVGPVPRSGANRVDTTLDDRQALRDDRLDAQENPPDSPATLVEPESDDGSAGWLLPALLGAVGGLLLAGAALARRVLRQRR